MTPDSQMNFMLSKWQSLTNTLKDVMTVDPSRVLVNSTEEGRLIFLNKLEEIKSSLHDDCVLYIDPTFSHEHDTVHGLCMRYTHRVAYVALTRLMDAIKAIDMTKVLTYNDYKRYMHITCIPPQDAYHQESQPNVASDMMHELFTSTTFAHMHHITGNDRYAQYIVRHQAKTGFISVVRWLDELLSRAAVLDSFPGLPENLAGTNVITNHESDTKPLSVLDVGPDHSKHVNTICDKRVCLVCNLTHLTYGVTDPVMRRKYDACNCVMDRQHDTPSSLRYAYITRQLFIFDKQLGCDCADHKNLIATKTKQMKEVTSCIS